jgi:peptidoglycan/xylan/chitin deacetylase (PgdA/CDA1 family)
MTHRLPFCNLDDARLTREVHDSKAELESLADRPVQGFRAPSWDLSADLFGALVSAGYRYDASTYPSLLLPLLRRSVARRSSTGATRTESSIWAGVFGPTKVHRRAANGGSLVEVPMCTAPCTRFPYYHTLRFLLPAPAFAVLSRLTRARRGPITYQFHAVDFLDVARDGLDTRIERHPGMRLPLERKLALAEQAVAALGHRRRVVPLVEIVDQVCDRDRSAQTDAPEGSSK